MLRSNVLLLLLTFPQSFTAVLAAVTRQFDQVVAFGDNLADAGQGAYVLTNGAWPSESRYSQHRFTDGATYVERLATLIGVPLVSYAIAGATTNNADVQGYTGRLGNVPVPSLQEQVRAYIASNTLSQYAASRTLWILSGGTSNVHASLDQEISATPAIADLIQAARGLRVIGATKFLIPTVPMRGIYTPGSTFVATDASDRLLRYARDFTSSLQNSIKFESGLLIIDLYQYISDFQLRYSVFGLDPKKFGESCLKGIYHPIPGSVPGAVTACASSASYIWFDDYNPTAKIQSYMAGNAQRAMVTRGWL